MKNKTEHRQTRVRAEDRQEEGKINLCDVGTGCKTSSMTKSKFMKENKTSWTTKELYRCIKKIKHRAMEGERPKLVKSKRKCKGEGGSAGYRI